MDLIDGELIFKFARKIDLNCKIVGANDLNMLKNMEIIYIAFILEYVVLDIEKKIHGPNPDR